MALTVSGFLLFATLLVGGQSMQGITLWDGANWTYPAVEITGYNEDLSLIDFEDLTSAVCVTNGLWFLYSDGAFNTYSSGDAAVFFGVDSCQQVPDEMDNRASSVRYAGPPVDFRQDSLQTYRKSNFGGAESYNLFDASSVQIQSPQSLVVTGTSSWTLYSYPMFQGDSICVTPGQEYPDPGLYPATGIDWPFVYSLKKGCDSSVKLRPMVVDSYPVFLKSPKV